MSDPRSGLGPRPSMRWTRRGVLALGVGAGATAFGTEDQAQRNRALAHAHSVRRLPAIRAALAAAEPGFVFVGGNSHAEIVGNALAQRLPVVNGGIGGTSARAYAAQLDTVSFPIRAGAALLFLGTNDILRTAAPLSTGMRDGFEAAVRRILDRLAPHADVVLVAAVPPLGPEAVAERDPAAVAAYSAVLGRLGARPGCRFFDPFAHLRDGEAGLTTQAAPPDGVHLRDYDALATDLATTLRGIADTRRGPLAE